MRRRPNPLLTVVYPAVDVRGPAVQRLRTWTQGQTLPREAYRVIVGCDCKRPSEESELASLLAATDELIRLPNASDAELWNEAAFGPIVLGSYLPRAIASLPRIALKRWQNG